MGPGGTLDPWFEDNLDTKELGALTDHFRSLSYKDPITTVPDFPRMHDRLQSVHTILERLHARQGEVSSGPSVTAASANACDIAIICALRKPELEKVLAIGSWKSLPVNADDATSYRETTYETKKGHRLRRGRRADSDGHAGLRGARDEDDLALPRR